jgi:glutamyl endopeptidase
MNETVTQAIGPALPLNENCEVVITSAGGVVSSASRDPNESFEGQENPVPVRGHVPEKWEPSIDPVPPEKEPVDRLIRDPDGQYRFDDKVIIGPDGRVRVSNTAASPWCVHGHMITRFPNGRTYIGSGTMVNRHHVLTAGHNVFNAAYGGWATSVQFNPAQNDNSLPKGTAWATRLLSVTGWTQSGNSDFDMGMLVLDRQLGDRTGWHGVITFGSDSDLHRYRVNVTGYPGDKGGQQMWTMADVIKAVGGERFLYDIDTYGGQSGSGVWSSWPGHSGNKVAGIHTTGSASGNGATRISRAKFDRIVEWMQQW